MGLEGCPSLNNRWAMRFGKHIGFVGEMGIAPKKP
jgi:hypothetical protein